MRDLFVSCPYGFESLLQKELLSLGIPKVFPRFCGVLIPKNLHNVFIANYQSRVATRVLWPLAEFNCGGKEDLYANCRKINWSLFLNPQKTFAIDSNVQHPKLTNSLFAAMVVKDAICDHFRDKTGSRPSVDLHNPDLQLNLFIQKGKATLYLDTSGAPLHKRGWRTTSSEASLHESIAAGLLLLTGYSADKIFCDPFCGSGTFLIEAAWIATKTPPGILRKKWGFFHLPEFSMPEWKEWKKKKDEERIPLTKGKIFGADKSREASEICKKNLLKAEVSSIEIAYQEIAFYTPPHRPNFILTNPPYGKRLETSEALFKDLKVFLDRFLDRGSFHMICPEQFSSTLLEKKPSSEFLFKNGGLPVKLLSFEKDSSIQ